MLSIAIHCRPPSIAVDERRLRAIAVNPSIFFHQSPARHPPPSSSLPLSRHHHQAVPRRPLPLSSLPLSGRRLIHRRPLLSIAVHHLLDLQVGTYLLVGRIPAKATKHLKSDFSQDPNTKRERGKEKAGASRTNTNSFSCNSDKSHTM